MFCKYCGAKIDNQSIFCGECGEVLKKQNTDKQLEEKSKKAVDAQALDKENNTEIIEKVAEKNSRKLRVLIIVFCAASILVLSCIIAIVIILINDDGGNNALESIENSIQTTAIVTTNTTEKITEQVTTKVSSTTINTTVTTTVTTTTQENRLNASEGINIDKFDEKMIGIVITDDANGLNMRSGPSKDTEKIMTLNETSEILIDSVVDDDWYYCKYDNKSGYVKKEFVQAIPIYYYVDDTKITDTPVDTKLENIVVADIDDDGMFEAVAYYTAYTGDSKNKFITVLNKKGNNVIYTSTGINQAMPYVIKDRNIDELYLGEITTLMIHKIYPPEADRVIDQYSNLDASKKEKFLKNMEIISPYEKEKISDKYADGHWIKGVYTVNP